MGAPFEPSGEPTAEFVALLLAGRERGHLTPDDLMTVLQGVELSPDLISAVLGRVAAEGIEWRELGELLTDEALDKLASEVVSEPAAVRRSAGRSDAGGVAGTGGPQGTAQPPVEGGTGHGGFLRKRRQREALNTRRRLPVAGLRVDVRVASAGGADSVRAYLHEIGRVRLLTAKEEVALARCAVAGRAAAARLDETSEGQDDAGQGAAAKAARRHALERQRQADERLRAEGMLAREVLVEANLRLVVSVAKWYRSRGMPFLDLVQEGNLGLMRAVERFDYTKGFKFSTYATWWVRQAISRAIADQARTIRIPVHMVDNINAVLRSQRSLLQELGREPTIEEVAARAEMTTERAQEILRISQDTVSLEQPLGEDDFSLSDTLEDPAALSPSDVATRSMLAEALRDVLSDLTERERRVVRMRFGLDDGQVRTLEEVGKEFGVTRERVRQIESKTLAKLRQPGRRGKLAGYLDN